MRTAESPLTPRDRILTATIDLLARGGIEAVSARSVSAAARVQATTIYRQFGDMKGLLTEVTSYGFAAYLSTKTIRVTATDPVDDLRLGWDLHVDFGLTNPALYTLMYGHPRPGPASPAAVEAEAILHGLVERVAQAGRLRVDVNLAVEMIHCAGVGVVLTLLATAEDERSIRLSTAACEGVLSAVTVDDSSASLVDPGSTRAVISAVGLQAVLPQATSAFTDGERLLLSEWLYRIAGSASVADGASTAQGVTRAGGTA